LLDHPELARKCSRLTDTPTRATIALGATRQRTARPVATAPRPCDGEGMGEGRNAEQEPEQDEAAGTTAGDGELDDAALDGVSGGTDARAHELTHTVQQGASVGANETLSVGSNDTLSVGKGSKG
jgi:hypothetical protein